MPNVGAQISSHNKKILGENVPLERGECNCRVRADCPLEGECLSRNVLYEAKISSDIENYEEKVYIGLTEPTFKERFRNHQKSFNHKKYAKETALSKEVWNIKDRNGSFTIKWRIIKQCPTYTQTTKRCMLCVHEKNDIAFFEGDNLLNKRTEIISTCRHRLKHSLGIYDVN